MKRRADRSLFDRNVKLPISYYRETFLNYARKVYTNGDSYPTINDRYIYRGYLRLGAILWFEESISNPIQYSSEVYDPELGLISYNYRHYNPEDGRWLTRDPIQEDGGLNLYGFAGSNPIFWFDYLGGKVIKGLKAEYCTNKISFFKEKSDKVEDAPYQILRGTTQPRQEDIDKVINMVTEVGKIVDKCGNKCYEIDIYLCAVNTQGIKALPWEGYDRAILLAHTTKGVHGDAPKKFFQISSESAKKEDKTEIDNTEISAKVDIVGCHLRVGGIRQLEGLGIVIQKLKKLKAKEDCSTPERIQIISGTMLVFLSFILWFLTSMVPLNAGSVFYEDDELDPFTQYAPKDLCFKATEHFHDLVERYRDIIAHDDAHEFTNIRFCLTGVSASFNYFTQSCGGEKAWQLPFGGYTVSDPPDGSPSKFCPDPKRPPSKKFKFVTVVYDALNYVYGNRVYPKGELQALITDLVLDRFYFSNRLPYSYHIVIMDNPPLQECWYFMAVLHLFAENRVVYADTAG